MSNINEYQNENQKRINHKNVKYGNYTVTLTEEALKSGIFTYEDIENIQMKTADALCECIKIYTHGESTSVMNETANNLLNSLFFTIDAYLISLGSNDAALIEIKNESFTKLYYTGMKKLKLMIYETLGLLVKIKRSRIHTPNIIYNDIIDKKIMDFLKNYNIATASHENPVFTYPLAIPCGKMKGIYYIKCYLLNLYAENLFCREYDFIEINRLYKEICDKKKMPYTTAKINIYSFVYLNALFSTYLIKEQNSLQLTDDDCDIIQKLFSTLSESDQSEIIKTTAAKINRGNPDYNEKMINLWLPQILNSIKYKTLNKLLILT